MSVKPSGVLAVFFVLNSLFLSVFTQVDSVYAGSLSYNLACQDESSALSQTKQPAKHQVVVKCKSGAKFTYLNNASSAKSQVTGKCPNGQQVGSKVDVPNGKSSTLTLYCVSGTPEHMERTDSTPTVSSKKITPKKDGETAATQKEGTASCGEVDTIVISCDDNTNGVWGILLLVIGILSAGVGLVAVGAVVYAAIMWTTAEDKQDQINKAKSILTNAIIGIVTFALMWAGLQFLVPGGVFNRDYEAGSVKNSANNLPTTDGSSKGGGDNVKGGQAGDSDTPIEPSDIAFVKNLRDASASNSVLKPNTLYRSAQLTRLNDKNAERLSSMLGEDALIIDVRPPGGDTGQPDKSVPGVKNSNFPIDGLLDLEPMVTDAARASTLARVLKAAANAKGPVLIHCVAGKDRTGWIVAMIMYANGASDEEVMKEYLKSNESIPGGVKPEWLKNGVQAARSKHGTVLKYLKSIGLTSGDLKKLRTKFGA